MMEEGEYEDVDFVDKSSKPLPLPPPLKNADLVAALKKTMSQNSGGRPLPNRNGAPPPLQKKPPASPTRQGNSSGPSSAPPVMSKKPSPTRKKSEPMAKQFRSVSQDVTPSIFVGEKRERGFSPPALTNTAGEEMGRETLLLADLVRKHSKELPLRIRVDEGYCGSEERFVISAGDIYNFHFVKNEKVVSVKDCGNSHFSIPFNSEIKFGLLYNPNNDFKEAMRGHVFKSVSEVVAASQTPRLVKVLECPSTPSTKGTLERNELLVIKKASKTMLRKPFIKVYSIWAKEEKTLHDDCEAKFTTDPQSLQLYIPELLEQFPDSLPMETMMYPPGLDTEDLPSHLTTDKVTLAHTSIESAIIATTFWGDEDTGNLDDDEQMAISIPIEMDIEVTILEDIDEDELYQDTKTLLSHFDMTKVKDMKNDQREQQEVGGANKLHRRVRKGYEFRGVDITMSQRMMSDPGLPPSFKRAVDTPLPPTPDDLLLPSAPVVRSHSPKPQAIYANRTVDEPAPVPPTRGRSLDEDTHSPRNSRKQRSQTLGTNENFNGIQEDLYMNSDRYTPNTSLPPPPRSPGPARSLKTREDNGDPEGIADLRADTRFLRCLVDAMQQNFQKETQTMREDIARLTATVGELTESYRQLQSQLDTKGASADVPPRPAVMKKPVPLPPPAKETTTEDTSPPKELDIPVPKVPQPGAKYLPPKTKVPDEAVGVLSKTTDPDKQKENVAELRAMGVQEILYLLDILKLTQYKKGFLEENIDGEILAECDDLLLEEELHIKNKLHRNKLMKVITGKHSAHNIKHGLDPYGATVNRTA